MVQQTKERTRAAANQETAEHDATAEEARLKAAKAAGSAAVEGVTTEDIDKILADIDEVLEENPATFVEDFVQKGGQ